MNHNHRNTCIDQSQFSYAVRLCSIKFHHTYGPLYYLHVNGLLLIDSEQQELVLITGSISYISDCCILSLLSYYYVLCIICSLVASFLYEWSQGWFFFLALREFAIHISYQIHTNHPTHYQGRHFESATINICHDLTKDFAFSIIHI